MGRFIDGPTTHAFALAVYCTSWTFFGAVGTAARSGWDYLPILIGPMIVFLFGRPLVARMARQAQTEGASSIADFLAARYGKSRAVAAMAAIVATIGALPYIALQLHAVSSAFDLTVGSDPKSHVGLDIPALVTALALAGFAMVFGVRDKDSAARNRGLLAAVAAESLIKLVALGVVAVLAIIALGASGHGGDAIDAARLFTQRPDDRFVTLTVLAMAAALCLPRQFHITAVESPPRNDMRVARRIFPTYLLAIAAMAPPIAIAGSQVAPNASPDFLVLALPQTLGNDAVTLLVFLGGFSAATAMSVVAAVALSTMITNDIVAPIVIRAAPAQDLARRQVLVRRTAILALFVAAFAVHASLRDQEALADLGVLAFAAAAQLAPPLIGALIWGGANRAGALLGLGAGFTLWAALLALPTALGTGGVHSGDGFPGVGGLDPLTVGAGASLAANAAFLVLGTLVARPQRASDGAKVVTFGALQILLLRCLGANDAEATEHAISARLRRPLHADDAVPAAEVAFAERSIARVLGASSARVLMDGARRGGRVDLDAVVRIVDERRRELHFSQELLEAALENIAQGVSVVDKDLRLVAWNRRYLELFDYPKGLIVVGRHIADVIRYNAMQGECGPGEIDAHVARRLAHLRASRTHFHERVRPDGRVLRIQGKPIQGGGYVTSFTDITGDRRLAEELRDAKEGLERRVNERTRELVAANADLQAEHRRSVALADALERAKADAERATAAKTRFLAAASHDLLQPLNAARLFASALDEETKAAPDAARHLVHDIERSIASADRLLRALLDISKLDAGRLDPTVAPFPVADLFGEIRTEFAARAKEKGLRFRVADTPAWVRSDRGLLLSVLQNFVANAVRYTERGGVLVGARPRGPDLQIEVWDTGPGVPADARRRIFDEFERLSDSGGHERGLGLGLAIADRIARLLDHRLSLDSTVGRGSVFRVHVARTAAIQTFPARRIGRSPGVDPRLNGRRVLCVDDDPQARRALMALITRWGCRAEEAANVHEAVEAARRTHPELVIADYQLADGETGPGACDAIAAQTGRRPALAVVSAERTGLAHAAASAAGAPFLPKPVEPARLRALMTQMLRAAGE